MADWPQETTIAAFKRAWALEGEAFWTTVFSMHQEKMQIKSPKVAVANLQKIFEAAIGCRTSVPKWARKLWAQCLVAAVDAFQ